MRRRFLLSWIGDQFVVSTLTSIISATKGNDYVDDRTIRNPNTGDLFIRGLPFQEDIIWSNHTIGAGVRYEIVNGVHTSLNYQYMDIKDDARIYTSEYFLDSRHNLSFSLNVGF